MNIATKIIWIVNELIKSIESFERLVLRLKDKSISPFFRRTIIRTCHRSPDHGSFRWKFESRIEKFKNREPFAIDDERLLVAQLVLNLAQL